MVSTLEDTEYIVINKLAYLIGSPERGDIVVFRPPNEPSKYYVKRVIGMPGDVVELRNGKVYVQPAGGEGKEELAEPYLDERNHDNTFRHPPNSGDRTPINYTVPDGEYFLLGDNRQGSHDSRSFMIEGEPVPYVPESSIKGRVWFVALPITKIHAFSPQEYDL